MPLDLAYRPEPVVDTAGLTEQEWLDWRRKGIGGSDAASALGLSPYRTGRELYYDKVGIKPGETGRDMSITFEIGHLLEDVVAKIFMKKTGLDVFRDTMMYRHPLYPFMLADVDRFIHMPDGSTAVLELKTAHYDTRFLWANGAVPRHYELQVRHYLSVMNLNTAYIACLFSNSEDDFVFRKLERDTDEEETTILQLEYFWNTYVREKEEPPLIEKPEMALDTIRRYRGPADASGPKLKLPAKFLPELERIDSLRERKQALDTQSRALGEQIKAAYAPIADAMGTSCTAECADKHSLYDISYAPQYRESIPKDALLKLKEQYPDIYKDFVRVTESRTFKLKKKDII